MILEARRKVPSGEEGGAEIGRGHEGVSGVLVMLSFLSWVLLTQVCSFHNTCDLCTFLNLCYISVIFFKKDHILAPTTSHVFSSIVLLPLKFILKQHISEG